jgi:hypothetical protein
MYALMNLYYFLFGWLSFSRNMVVSYNQADNSIILTGKNDWIWVMTKRIIFVGTCFLLGYIILEVKNDLIIFRFIGAMLIVPPLITFVISLLYTKHPNLQKAKIIFTPNELLYTHTKNSSRVYHSSETDIKDFNIYYKMDNFHTNIKFWINGGNRPIFDFYLQEIKNQDQLFMLFGEIAKNWGLNYFDIYPSRAAIGRFKFLRTGNNKLNLKRPYKEQKELALKAQLDLESDKVKIGSYVFKRQGDNVLIDLVKSSNEWSSTFMLILIGSALAVLFFYLYYKEKLNDATAAAIILLGLASLFFFSGLKEAYANYYLQFLIDKKNKKLKIRNILLKWKEIYFGQITQVNFKGIITKGKYTTGYSGIIEIITQPDRSFHLMAINANYNGLDVDIIKESIYTDGMRITRILAANLGVRYIWFDFAEDN